MDYIRFDDLTRALYRVTERMEDSEPLKWELRQASLRIMKLVHSESETLTFSKEVIRELGVLSEFENITRLLDLAASLSYVSRMNFEVLLREYGTLKNEIGQAESTPLLSAESPSDSRQEKIVEFLEKNPQSSISKLSESFENKVSEKTLQRDLNELMASGRVRGEGERRWRTYSLP